MMFSKQRKSAPKYHVFDLKYNFCITAFSSSKADETLYVLTATENIDSIMFHMKWADCDHLYTIFRE